MPFVICITELYHAWNKIAPALIQSNKVSSKSSSHSSLLDIYFLDNYVVLFLSFSLDPDWKAFNFKMARYCSTAYTLFFVSVVLATAIADPCQIGLLNHCSAEYKDTLDATSTGEGGHCFRLQVWREKSLSFHVRYSSFDVYCFSENLKKYGTKRTYPSKCFNILSIYMYKYLQNVKTTRFMVWRPCEPALISIKAISAMLIIT